jgi:hypothetical protein
LDGECHKYQTIDVPSKSCRYAKRGYHCASRTIASRASILGGRGISGRKNHRLATMNDRLKDLQSQVGVVRKSLISDERRSNRPWRHSWNAPVTKPTSPKAVTHRMQSPSVVHAAPPSCRTDGRPLCLGRANGGDGVSERLRRLARPTKASQEQVSTNRVGGSPLVVQNPLRLVMPQRPPLRFSLCSRHGAIQRHSVPG